MRAGPLLSCVAALAALAAGPACEGRAPASPPPPAAKAEPPPPQVRAASKSGPAAAAPAPATTPARPATPAPPAARPAAVASAAQVDLLRSVPVEVRVSSTVRNPKILPAHLVDGDLATAWNSVTGELYGAWIEVRAPAGTAIKKVRLTPGFTGTGPKGESYFTMNPRISTVLVKCDGKYHGLHELKAGRRELQELPISDCQRVRLEVVDFELGSKPSWREISVSELEVWGTPPPGWTAPSAPLTPAVAVGPSPLEAAEAKLDQGTLERDLPCDGIEREREKFERERQERDGPGPGDEDRNYPPACQDLKVTPAPDLAAPWSIADAWCETPDEIYGSAECTIRVQHRRQRATLMLFRQSASVDGEVTVSTRDVLPGGADEALVRLSSSGAEYLSVCRTAPYLSCSPLLLVAENGWRADESFAKGALLLKPGTGKPYADSLGAFRLVFSSFSAASE